MKVPFESLPPGSRIWIYQANRRLTEKEATAITEEASQFIELWTAHKQKLHAGFRVLYNLFAVIAVNESINDASGCSIDASVAFMEQLEVKYGISFFDRMMIAYMDSDGIPSVASPEKVRGLLQSGAIDEQTTVFNNLVTTKAQLESDWKIPLRRSWVYERITA